MRTRTAVAGLALLLAAVAACGSGSGNSNSNSNAGGTSAPSAGGSSSGGPATSASPAAQVVVAQGVDADSMDPLQTNTTTTDNILLHIYDPLIMRKASDPTSYDPILATSWERVDDLTMRFTLRQGVTFSSGKPFTSADVVYTVDYLLGNLPGRKSLVPAEYPLLKGAKAVDDHTVDITTKEPDPLLLAGLSDLLIVPDGAVKDNDKELTQHPDGTGPYVLKTWDRNRQIVLTAKPDYFRGPAKISTVIFKVMPDASSRLAALQAGDVDLVDSVPVDSIDSINNSGRATVKTVKTTRIGAVWLNTLQTTNTESAKALKDPRVRLALNYAVDVDAIAEHTMAGSVTRVATVVAPNMKYFDPAVQPIPHDPAKAKELLAEAGYPNGFSMHIMVAGDRFRGGLDTVQALAAQLGEVGVKVTVDSVTYQVFSDATANRNPDFGDAFFAAYGGGANLSPIKILTVAVRSGTDGYAWYVNPKIDSLIDQAATTLDTDKAQGLVTEIQKQMLQDPPFIFLFAYSSIFGVANDLNWTPRSDEVVYLYEASRH